MKNHLRTYSVPSTWTGVQKKEQQHITKPAPGPHGLLLGMPLAVWFKNAQIASTKREVTKLLNTTNVMIDGRRIKDTAFPLGFMDVIQLADGTAKRVVFGKFGRLELVDTKKPDMKACRIIGKTKVKGGKLQLNLSDSRNILVDEKSEYKTGDSITIELPSQKILERLPLKKGASIVLVEGKHIGEKGTVEDVDDKLVTFVKDSVKIQTLKEYAFVMPKEL